eukprot:CAMPEP_0183819202 /NCGR_PEP_ID=MMETSP0803_2-20130417/63662_1 /TAXON_ID=195967 /ORGANISM="Crustomastix stigmata, Strain CCMP3273" /LENGTH=53 /DNA_ID=CAMNT_0026064089 /DNA_START=479 /DNA_END=636 /DNA_ORIENTATION=+
MSSTNGGGGGGGACAGAESAAACCSSASLDQCSSLQSFCVHLPALTKSKHAGG